MKKFICVILTALMLLSMLNVTAVAQLNIPEYIRVGLFYNSTAKTALTVSGENVSVNCEGVEPVISSTFSIGIGDYGFLINDTLYQTTTVEFIGENDVISVDGKPYRGYIRLLLTDKGINVINVVKLEEYLYGVLPLEMSTGWPVEALKAQAVCARTYAAKDIGRFEQYGFDVTDTTLSQVYGGIKVEKSDCTQAVDETRGMIATYNGKIAETYYFATSNGTTLDVKDVWGGTNYPYLVPVDDSLQSNVIKDNGKWSVKFTKSELTDIFKNKGVEIGEVIDVTADEYNEQGAVMKLTIKGADGSKTYTKGKTRDILALRSQTYSISKLTSGGTEKELSVLTADGKTKSRLGFSVTSANGIQTIANKVNVLSSDKIELYENTDGEFEGIEINGTGYGHGIGMSQNGAKALALDGYTFDNIIKHYYTGIELTNISLEETNDETVETVGL